MPPVLDIALEKLSSRGSQHMFACKARPRERQRHHVLQLIAETERPSGLVIPAASPEPAADRLIEQPMIQQRIERIVWRPHLDAIERVIPGCAYARSSRRGRVEMSVPGDQLTGVTAIGAFAEQEKQLPALARLQYTPDVQSGTGIQRRAGGARQGRVAERGGP